VTRRLPAPATLSPEQDESEKEKQQKIAIVTGSNTGIGFETAKALVVKYGYTVILACRSRDKAMRAVETINEEAEVAGSQGRAVFVHPLDLSSFQSVREFAAELKKQHAKLHLLVNNAGLSVPGSVKQEDTGMSMNTTFTSNFTGHFLLTSLLMPILVRQKNTRIINLSSVMHHFAGNTNSTGEHVCQEQFWRDVATPRTRPRATYPASKLAAVLFTAELNRRYGDKVLSVAVNPGGVNSDIWRGVNPVVRWLFKLIYLTNEQGCSTTLAAALLPAKELEDHLLCPYLQPYWLPGNYTKRPPFPLAEMLAPYAGHVRTRARLPSDPTAAGTALWKVSCGLTGAEWTYH
jgi:NAD(P)-dependent dehydrogenase (short-subunit alcohol dehydrogenase family)